MAAINAKNESMYAKNSGSASREYWDNIYQLIKSWIHTNIQNMNIVNGREYITGYPENTIYKFRMKGISSDVLSLVDQVHLSIAIKENYTPYNLKVYTCCIPDAITRGKE